jgi:O-antigen/teichoic acid export membrane protein
MSTEPTAPAGASSPHTLLGGVRVFLAESLLIPTGLLTAAYLARRLGPDGYGLFAVAAAVVGWVEWGIASLFSRASVRFVADAADWRPVGATIVSAHLVAATVGALLLAAAADPLAALLGTSALSGPILLFAVDVPFFCLAQAHRNILIGLGRFGERALAAAARWISRLLLILLFVGLGLSIAGAILGSIGASAIELAICRRFVRPALSVRAVRRGRMLWGFAAPLILSAFALRIFDKLDLVTLTLLGGTPEQAGHYGAAQNLSLLPALFALSFAPLLLSSLTRAFRENDDAAGRRIGIDAIRWVFLLLPFAALAAGSAPELVALVFGPRFAPAGPLLPPLLFAAAALALVSVATSMLIAVGRPGLALALTAPLPGMAVCGYMVLIPRLGPMGAALVTLLGAVLTALALILAVHRVCLVLPPGKTVLVSGVLSAGAYIAAALWPTHGALVVLELVAIGAGLVGATLVAGELTSTELRAICSWWRRSV